MVSHYATHKGIDAVAAAAIEECEGDRKEGRVGASQAADDLSFDGLMDTEAGENRKLHRLARHLEPRRRTALCLLT